LCLPLCTGRKGYCSIAMHEHNSFSIRRVRK
jgi:hypothetical protein